MAHCSCYNGHDMWNGDGKPTIWTFKLDNIRRFQDKHPDARLGTEEHFALFDCIEKDPMAEPDCWYCDECGGLVVFLGDNPYGICYVPRKIDGVVQEDEFSDWTLYVAMRDAAFEAFDEFAEGKAPYTAVMEYKNLYRCWVSLDKETIVVFDATGQQVIQYAYQETSNKDPLGGRSSVMQDQSFKPFTGTPVKIKMVYSPSMFLGHWDRELIQAKLSINSNGRVDYTTTEDHFPVVTPDAPAHSGGCWEKRKTTPEVAQQLLDSIATPFRTMEIIATVCDGDMWELTITNEAGENFHYLGFSAPDCFEGANEISYYIRTQLMLPDFPAFDGGFCDHIRQEEDFIFCDVQMQYVASGRRYWYITEDESLGIGGLIVAPFGKENREVIGKIVDIKYRPADEAPFPIEKTKKILRKCTEEDLEPYKPNHVIGHCQLFDQEVTNEQCWQICEYVDDFEWADDDDCPLPEFADRKRIEEAGFLCENCPLRKRFN